MIVGNIKIIVNKWIDAATSLLGAVLATITLFIPKEDKRGVKNFLGIAIEKLSQFKSDIDAN